VSKSIGSDQLKDNKPQLNLTNTEFNAIAVMAR